MDEDAALPAHVVSLFRELECVLEDARARLDALVRDAVPVQGVRMPKAEPGSGGR